MNLSAHLSLSRHIHCPIVYIQTGAWTQIWPSCHRGVQTAWSALLCAKGSVMCVGWPRQDERGAPLSSRDSPQPEAALCNNEHNSMLQTKELSHQNTLQVLSLPATGTSFPMVKWGERIKKVSQHPVSTVSDFKLENRTWVPRCTLWINTEKRGAAMNKWYTSSTLAVKAAF